MKLIGLVLLSNPSDKTSDPVVCVSAVDVSSVGYLQRSSVRELIIFLSRMISKSLAVLLVTGQLHQVKEKEYCVHAFPTPNGITAVAITDESYPANNILSILQGLSSKFWHKYQEMLQMYDVPFTDEFAAPFYENELWALLKKHETPVDPDSIFLIRQQLEETKVVLHQAVDSLLERGTHIDELVSKSAELGFASKAFYKTAKKTNSSCCSIT